MQVSDVYSSTVPAINRAVVEVGKQAGVVSWIVFDVGAEAFPTANVGYVPPMSSLGLSQLVKAVPAEFLVRVDILLANRTLAPTT